MGLLDKLRGKKTLSTGSITPTTIDSEKLMGLKKILEDHITNIKSQKKLNPTTKAELDICKILLKVL